MTIEDKIIKDYSFLLDKLSINTPLNSEIVINLSEYISISHGKKCLLVLNQEDLGDQLGSFTPRRIAENKYIFYITYNKSFDREFHILDKYKRIRKATIIHEFCHFISFSINLIKINYEDIFDKYISELDSNIRFADFLGLLNTYDKESFKEYYDNHFKYCDDDNIDYVLLFEKLLLPDEIINKIWIKHSASYMESFFIQNDMNHFTEFIALIKNILTDDHLVFEKIVFNRLKDTIKHLLVIEYDKLFKK